jgi:hypothetical protein
MIEKTPGYQAIVRHYGDRRTKRSGVSLIDHINQGIKILRRIGADEVTMEAYAVHPIFQADADLKANFFQCADLNQLVVLYALEYRNMANRSLSDIVIESWQGGPHNDYRTLLLDRPIATSPLDPVNQMLIADKVQNRKDFLIYHKGSHPRSAELDFYFNSWLKALGVDEQTYLDLVKDL